MIYPLTLGVKEFFAALGHNVTTTHDVQHGQLQGKSDYHQLRFATWEQRIFLTHDRDFHQQHLARLIERSPGVIAVRGQVTPALLKKM